MFTITYAAALLSVFLTMGAAAFALSRNNTELARALALYCLTAAFWIGGNAAADVSYTDAALRLTSSIAYLGGALNLFLFLILVDLLIDSRMPSRMRLFLYAVPTLGMASFAFSGFAIQGTYFPISEPAQIIPGPLYLITLFILLAALSYSLARLLYALSVASSEERKVQLSYVLLGLMLSLLGEIVFDVGLPLMGELRFYTLGPITSLFFIIGCAYVITEQRLFDIRLGVQRSMVYSFLLALIIGVYTGALYLLLLLSPLQSVTAIYLSAGATMIAGILGAPIIERYFKRLTDPIFFKDAYDYAEALHTLSSILYRETELVDVVRETEQELTRTLRTDSVRIYYADHGVDTADPEAITSGHVLAVPISRDGAYIGSIHTGRKRSGDAYTPQDRKLLETFAYQAATAFSRAELYEKTKRHAHELERTVEKRTREIRTMQENERQMLIDLSHNLQTPLTIFLARLEQLKQRKPATEDVQSLELPVRRLSGFIYDLLALAKLESEKPNIHVGLNLSELIGEIAEELEIIAESKGVQIKSDIEPTILITGDEKRLREAFLNIASNALTYMRDEGERRVTFTLTREDANAHLSITDTGRGIAASELPRVFERFYRGTTTKDTTRGNGLGLSIVRRIVEQHGGQVEIASVEGNGTEVHIHIPASQP